MSIQTLEKDAEEDFVKYAAFQDCWAAKLILLGKGGFPDRTIFCPGGRIFFIEFKHGDNKASGPQGYFKKMLLKLGFEWIICYSCAEASKALDDFLEKT